MFISAISRYPFSLMASFWPDLNRKAQFATGCSFGAETAPANHNTLSMVGRRTCKLDKLPQVRSFWWIDWSNLMVFSNCAGKKATLASPWLFCCAGSHKFCAEFWCYWGQTAFSLTMSVWRMRTNEDAQLAPVLFCTGVMLHWTAPKSWAW